MSEIIGAVMLGLMAIIALIASGFILYGGVMTLWSVVAALTQDLHFPEFHHTGGLAPHH